MIVFKDLGIHSGPSGGQDLAVFSGSSSSLLKRLAHQAFIFAEQCCVGFELLEIFSSSWRYGHK